MKVHNMLTLLPFLWYLAPYQICSHQSKMSILTDSSVHSLCWLRYDYNLPRERTAIKHNLITKRKKVLFSSLTKH